MKRPLFYFAGFFSSGIFVSHFFSYQILLWFLCLGLLAVCLFPLIYNQTRSVLLIYLLFFFFGIVIYAFKAYFPSSERIDRFDFSSSRIRLRGNICEFVQISSKREIILNATHIFDEENIWRLCSGKVLLKSDIDSVHPFEEFDRIELEGKIIDLPFNYFKDQKGFREWLRAKGVAMVAQISSLDQIKKLEEPGLNHFEKLLKNLKSWCARSLSLGFSNDSSSQSLLQAMLLGTRSDLDPTLKSPFLYTNTIHILSISGLHLSVILIGILFALGFFSISKRWIYGMALFAIWIYALMTGLSIPILRSAIMASFFLAGGILRRKVDLANSLGASALLILVFDPFSLFDPGFQLSYSCLISLIFLTPRIERDLQFLQWVPSDMIPLLSSARERSFARGIQWLLKILSGSFAVWIGVLPVISYHFQLFSLVTVFANLIAVPLVGVIMNLGFVTCLLGFVDVFPLCLNAVNEFLLISLIRVIDAFSKIPYAYFFIQEPSWSWTLLYYGIVFLGVLKSTPRIKCIYFLGASLILVPLLFPIQKKDVLSVHLFGDDAIHARMVRWPDGHRSLWLKRPESFSKKNDSPDRLKTVFKIKKVNHVFLEDDVMEGFQNRFKINAEFMNPRLEEVLKDKEIKVKLSDPIDLALVQYQDVWIKWLNPKDIDREDLMGEGKAVFIVSKDVTDFERLIKFLDRGKVMGLIFSGDFDQIFREELDLRKIPYFKVFQGRPFVLETDGKSVWVKK